MSAVLIEHAEFCQPRPGHDEPRTETYVHTTDAEDPRLPPRRTLVSRCVECAGAHYTTV